MKTIEETFNEMAFKNESHYTWFWLEKNMPNLQKTINETVIEYHKDLQYYETAQMVIALQHPYTSPSTEQYNKEVEKLVKQFKQKAIEEKTLTTSEKAEKLKQIINEIEVINEKANPKPNI